LRIFRRERNRLSRRLSRAESQHDCSWPPGCCSRQGHTLEILQSLGFIYHIDDVSRDGPFLINVRDKPFVVVPYTLHMNDIVDYETQYFSTAMYADGLKAEFEALYAEARTRRRMMSVSAHARIAGRRLAQRCSKSSSSMPNLILPSRSYAKMRLRALSWRAP
jgi:hypothetical protein